MSNSKILVVEDEIIVAADLKNKLEKMGYTIIDTATTGHDAVKKSGETKPDLVLMDIMLKGEMDGIDAAQQIRDLYDIPIVYLTAYFDDETLERAKVTEPFGYVLKPFDDMGIQSVIEMAIYKHQVEQRLKKQAKILKFSNEMLNEINEL